MAFDAARWIEARDHLKKTDSLVEEVQKEGAQAIQGHAAICPTAGE
jgi:hypothetical protein